MKDNVKRIINTFDQLVLKTPIEDIREALFVLETKYKVSVRK